MAKIEVGARVALAHAPAVRGTVTGFEDMPGSVLVEWDGEPGVTYAELVEGLAVAR